MTEAEDRPTTAPGKEKNWVSVLIRHEGQTVSLSFNIHQKIKKVTQDAVKALSLQPPPNAVIYLRFGDVSLDDPEKSLQDYQIPDGATLDLLFRTRAG